MKNLAFIRKYIKPRETSSNVSCRPTSLSQESTHNEDGGTHAETSELKDLSDTENIPLSNSPVSPAVAATSKRRKTSSLNSIENELLKIVREPLPRENDEHELFCLSLAPALKRMTARNKSKAKMKILEIMDEYEFNQPEIPPTARRQ